MAGLRTTYRNGKKRLKLYTKVNWIKTLYFNFKKFPFGTARKLPVFFYGSVKLADISGTITIEAPIRKGMIGFGQPYELISRSKGIAEVVLRGTLCFKGHVQFGKDYQIVVDREGYVEMGHMSSLASSGRIICKERIVFGTYTRIGSEAQLLDTNFHQMFDTQSGEKFPLTGTIELGNYNFISNRVSFMLGTRTPDYCTIASNTLCNKDYRPLGQHVLIGGIPAKLLREHISRDWEGEKEALKRNLQLF